MSAIINIAMFYMTVLMPTNPPKRKVTDNKPSMFAKVQYIKADKRKIKYEIPSS